MSTSQLEWEPRNPTLGVSRFSFEFGWKKHTLTRSGSRRGLCFDSVMLTEGTVQGGKFIAPLGLVTAAFLTGALSTGSGAELPLTTAGSHSHLAPARLVLVLMNV